MTSTNPRVRLRERLDSLSDSAADWVLDFIIHNKSDVLQLLEVDTKYAPSYLEKEDDCNHEIKRYVGNIEDDLWSCIFCPENNYEHFQGWTAKEAVKEAETAKKREEDRPEKPEGPNCFECDNEIDIWEWDERKGEWMDAYGGAYRLFLDGEPHDFCGVGCWTTWHEQDNAKQIESIVGDSND